MILEALEFDRATLKMEGAVFALHSLSKVDIESRAETVSDRRDMRGALSSLRYCCESWYSILSLRSL